MRPDRLGLVIGAIFGLVYVEVNARAVPSPAGPLLQVLGAIASTAGVCPGALLLAGSWWSLMRGTDSVRE